MSPAIPRATSWPQMYRWTRPRIAVPVHGELRHMAEHARLAKSLQVPEALVPANGQLYRLAPGPAELIDEVPSGRIHHGRPGAGGGRRGAGEGPPRHGLCRSDRHHLGAGRQGPGRRRCRHPGRRHAASRWKKRSGLRWTKPCAATIPGKATARSCARLSAAPRGAPRRMPGARSPSPVLPWCPFMIEKA